MNFFIRLLYFIILSLPVSLYAQIPDIPQSMINQVQRMDPQEQMRLAQQYGLGGAGAFSGGMQESSAGTQIGDRAAPMTNSSDQILYKRLMQGLSNEERLTELQRKLKPVFERNYADLENVPIYGRSIFDSDVSTYASVDNAPVPDNYRIGVGDSLNITLYGSENIQRELNINRSGEINFPKIGSLNVAGMTFAQMTQYINNRVSNELIGVNVSISMGALRSINVFVAGEARVAGAYSVSALSTASQVLFVAGGVSEIGSLRNIAIKNNGLNKGKFDVYKLLVDGDTQGDIRLQSGDVIFIPPIEKTVIIDGAVRRPGRYEIIANETLTDLLNLSGGLDSRAYLKKIFIERYTNDNDLPIIINLDISKNQNANFKIEDGDIIRIASVSNRSNNSITIKGAHQRPGKYGWYDGITLTDIINNIDIDLLENADISQALIVRRNNFNDISTISVDLKKAIDSPKSEFDYKLQPLDEVVIFSKVNNENFLLDPVARISKANPDPTVVQQDTSEEGDNNVMANESSEASLSNNAVQMMASDQLQSVMTNREYEKLASEIEQELLIKDNFGNERRILLEPIMRKLYQQADMNESIKVVFISGGVKSPGEYPLSTNANFSNLIKLAGGYTDDALAKNAELRRLSLDSNGSIQTLLINVNLDNESLSGSLLSRDHLRINRIKDWNINDSIELTGEVFYPGTYLISPNETLSSVIARAGGFTSESFINGAIFTRESIKEKERQQLSILGNNIRRDQASRSMTKESEDFAIASDEIESSIEALLSTEVSGRLIIDLPRVMNGDVAADFALQDGDILNLPKYTNAVTVVGEVRRAGSFVRQASFSMNDYIELAAGMTERGDKKQIYVIRADGSVDKINGSRKREFLTFSGPLNEIMAGDTIVVPIKSSYQSPLNLYSTVSQVIFQSIASLAAITTVLR